MREIWDVGIYNINNNIYDNNNNINYSSSSRSIEEKQSNNKKIKSKITLNFLEKKTKNMT